MDLKKLTGDQTSTMDVRHPVSEEILRNENDEPISIELHSADSEVYRAELRKRQNKRLERSLKKGSKALTAEEIDRHTVEILAAVTADWSNIEWEGEALPFSHKNAVMLYESLPWLREQVDRFVTDRENFF